MCLRVYRCITYIIARYDSTEGIVVDRFFKFVFAYVVYWYMF